MDRKEIVGMVVMTAIIALAYGILIVATSWDSTACVVLHSFFGWCG